MKTELHIVDDKTGKIECPIDIFDIPNRMGINLCAVEALSWTRQDDGQLKWIVKLTIPGQEK